jgi:NTE family protein
LSSSGAKGLAHIGVIQVLEENGIPIDAIAGSSIGAYVGSLLASGLTGQEFEALAA